MFSNARGMAICIGVTGVASILLWFYFKNRIESVETKLDNMFNMIQNFAQPPESETVRDGGGDYYQQVGGDGVVDPFEQKYGEEIKYENQNSSPQLPTTEFEKEIENVVNSTEKLIEVSDDSDEESDDESDEESEEGKKEEESDEESDEEIGKEQQMELQNAKEDKDTDSLDEVEDSSDEDEESEEDDEVKKVELKEEVKEYSSMKVSELKKLAAGKGLTGYTKLNKAGLVNLLENN